MDRAVLERAERDINSRVPWLVRLTPTGKSSVSVRLFDYGNEISEPPFYDFTIKARKGSNAREVEGRVMAGIRAIESRSETAERMARRETTPS